ncbi:hypothetical protein CSW57_10635 [Williamsia muralis]|uniref:GGDEF domain-containing protein n=1 Tax=Williamsia marianensis TaxID=85044 RepID=A0A2G3PLM9_WILMA|nr:hypothetical protein CSW57_10635 [Williamsia marianensis]
MMTRNNRPGGGLRSVPTNADRQGVQAVIDALPIGAIVLSQDGLLQLANDVASSLFELDERQVDDMSFPGGFGISFHDSQGELVEAQTVSNSQAGHVDRIDTATVFFENLNGQKVWLEMSRANLRPDDPECSVLLSFRDITELHLSRKRLFAGDVNDQLTGLPRLPAVLEHLASLLQRPPEDVARSNVVMVINFDKLRELNASLGHLRGDEALAETAQRLRDCLPRPHLLGRVVGAEFIAVLQEVDQDFVDDISDSIHLALTEPVIVEETAVRLRASVGITHISPDDERSPEEIVSSADTAMYVARNKGGGHTVDFGSLQIRDVLEG